MKKYQQGNLFLGILAAFLILSVVYFLIVPKVKNKAERKEQLPSDLAHQLSEANNLPPPKIAKEEYDGSFSWTNKVDITQNPFNDPNAEISRGFKFPEKNIPIQNKPPQNIQKKEIIISNIYEETPTGYSYPQSSDFLEGYPYNNDKGSLIITINNEDNNTDLLIYLFKTSDLNSKNTNSPLFSRAIYIKHNESFTINDLQSGDYSLRWLELSNGLAYEYPIFSIYQDNKFKYNRYFKFKKSESIKFKRIDTSLFY